MACISQSGWLLCLFSAYLLKLVKLNVQIPAENRLTLRMKLDTWLGLKSSGGCIFWRVWKYVWISSQNHPTFCSLGFIGFSNLKHMPLLRMFPKFIPSRYELESPLCTCTLKTSCSESSTHFFLKCPYFQNPCSCLLNFLLLCKKRMILWDLMQCRLQATWSFQSNEDCGQMTSGPGCAGSFPSLLSA